MNFSKEEVKNLLERMRFGVEIQGNKIKVLIPAYRTDVMHPVDLIEDIAISYGYDKLKPELPNISTLGGIDEFEDFSRKVRELAIGFGFQEVMTLILTNEKDLFERMNISPIEKVVEAENPVSLEHSIARTSLLSSLMQILEHNKNREYPQKIFEIGDCILGGTTGGEDVRKFSALIAHEKANFSEIKAIVSGIFESLDLFYEIKKFKHGSFISGRCASIEEKYGFFGEIHPQVLENFSLEVPVTGFELNLTEIFKKLHYYHH
jgi:phenylalanyl-tRNA synthetase beta chain